MTDPVTAPEKLGIKETREVLKALNNLTIFLLSILLDGLQLYKDGKAIIVKLKDDDEFRRVIQDAIDNIQAVPAEIKDLDASEGITLAGDQLAFLPMIFKAISEAPRNSGDAKEPGG